MNGARLCGAAGLLALLAACQPPAAQTGVPPQNTPPSTIVASSDKAAVPIAASCQMVADAGAVTTERGIGGTGISDRPPGSMDTADRGIGGTGVDSGEAITKAVRGRTLGEHHAPGTAVFGIVTGFASLCLDGLEIDIESPGIVSEDGVAQSTDALRVGQIVSVAATGPSSDLRAVSLTIDHDVVGPVEAITAESWGMALDVAGQHVRVGKGIHAPAGLKPGDWIAVSGLRDDEGDIHATRIDTAPSGMVKVVGRPERDGDVWRLGGLTLRFSGRLPPAGERVALAGDYADRALRVASIRVDRPLAETGLPHHLIAEGFAQIAGPTLHLSEGITAAIGPAFGDPPPPDHLVLVDLTIDQTGTLTAVSWLAADR